MPFLRHDGVEEAGPMLRRDVRSIFAVMVASTLLSPARAQADSVRALPRASFDGSRLHPYVNAWRYDVTLPDGSVHPQGVWTDQLLKTTRDGRDVFVRAQGTVFVNGTTAAVLNVFDPKTLMPISDEQTLKGGGLQKRSFDKGGIEARRTDSAGAAEKVTVTPATGALYDYYGGMYALLLATAPLKEGYQASFSSIDEFEDKPIEVEFKVLGREEAPAGARGSIETWKVASSRPGQYDLVAWVTDQPPYVIRLNILTPDKRLYDWTMI